MAGRKKKLYSSIIPGVYYSYKVGIIITLNAQFLLTHKIPVVHTYFVCVVVLLLVLQYNSNMLHFFLSTAVKKEGSLSSTTNVCTYGQGRCYM